MYPHGQHRSFGFGATLTPVGKIMLIVYASIYILELLCEHWLAIPLYGWLALNPLRSGTFQFWQVLTHPVIHNPGAPISFLINCLVFYFFAGTIESALGTRRFLALYIAAAVGGVIAGLLFSGLASFSVPYAGMMPSLLALIVTFGLLQPEAVILLFFVLPVKAKFISYGTVIVTALTFLAKANVHGAYHLGGILFGYLYFRPPFQLLNPNWWRWKSFDFFQRRKKSRFTVIKGDKNDDDRPTIH